MIEENIREAIRTLYESGKTKRGIARKELFVKCIRRALKYSISRIESVEKIAGRLLKDNIEYQVEIHYPDGYENRSSYQQGRISREVDLKQYQKLIEDNNHE